MGVEESSFPFAGSLSWSLNALNCPVWIINFPALSTSWALPWTVSWSFFLARAFSFFIYFISQKTVRLFHLKYTCFLQTTMLLWWLIFWMMEWCGAKQVNCHAIIYEAFGRVLVFPPEETQTVAMFRVDAYIPSMSHVTAIGSCLNLTGHLLGR